MEMHTRPSLYTGKATRLLECNHDHAAIAVDWDNKNIPFGCHISEVNLQVGGEFG